MRGFLGFPDAIGGVVVKAQIESVGIQVFPDPGFCGVANLDAGRPDGCFVRFEGVQDSRRVKAIAVLVEILRFVVVEMQDGNAVVGVEAFRYRVWRNRVEGTFWLIQSVFDGVLESSGYVGADQTGTVWEAQVWFGGIETQGAGAGKVVVPEAKTAVVVQDGLVDEWQC